MYKMLSDLAISTNREPTYSMKKKKKKYDADCWIKMLSNFKFGPMMAKTPLENRGPDSQQKTKMLKTNFLTLTTQESSTIKN